MDENVKAVQAKLAARAEKGLGKYGVTTERPDFNLTDWLRHLQEELMDGAVYIEAALATGAASKPSSAPTPGTAAKPREWSSGTRVVPMENLQVALAQLTAEIMACSKSTPSIGHVLVETYRDSSTPLRISLSLMPSGVSKAGDPGAAVRECTCHDYRNFVRWHCPLHGWQNRSISEVN